MCKDRYYSPCYILKVTKSHACCQLVSVKTLLTITMQRKKSIQYATLLSESSATESFYGTNHVKKQNKDLE